MQDFQERTLVPNLCEPGTRHLGARLWPGHKRTKKSRPTLRNGIHKSHKKSLLRHVTELSPEKPRRHSSGNRQNSNEDYTNCPPHLTVVRQILRAQQFLEEWKKAIVILIPKQENKFRTICLLDTLGKLVEHVIKQRLERQLEKKNALSDNAVLGEADQQWMQ
ncbi:hypothetical protein JTB14_023791 [Gonioctena quinquepunctata]|nr:hypothetical protein JTB14_023791 [Gonioctena quinquepunctata]